MSSKKKNNTEMIKVKKCGTTKNCEDLDNRIEKIKEEPLFPLRIDARTIIFVPERKHNPTYIDEWKRIHSLIPDSHSSLCKVRNLDKDYVISLLTTNMNLKDICRELGLSTTTLRDYMKKNNLRRSR